MATTGTDGINLWVEVRDEHAGAGDAGRPGHRGRAGDARSWSRRWPSDHLRLTVGLVRDGTVDLADRVATAARGQARSGRRRV